MSVQQLKKQIKALEAATAGKKKKPVVQKKPKKKIDKSAAEAAKKTFMNKSLSNQLWTINAKLARLKK